MLPKEIISARFAAQKETAGDGYAVTSMSCRLHVVFPRYCQKTHMQGSGHLLFPTVGLRQILERRWRSCSKRTFPTPQQMMTTWRHIVGQDPWTTILPKSVTYKRVVWSIKTFPPFKSPGKDGVYHALLQHGMDTLAPLLVKTFRTCLAMSYVPSLWKEITAVFIPKPGRSDYSDPKSFRPISPTSFLLKTLERLIDRYIKEGLLQVRPLHPNQYAYQQGKSTETALHHLVRRVEGALFHKQETLEAFLDVEGAFDNSPFEVICSALAERGLKLSLCEWIRFMLSRRRVCAPLHGDRYTVVAARGCPQERVLSPLLWSLVVDGLLWKLNDAGLRQRSGHPVQGRQKLSAEPHGKGNADGR